MLSRDLAQSISEKMMEIIPYNVNVMDNKGMIIGSGDSKRIGSIHEVAVETLKKKKSIEVKEESGKSKPGVNTPIFFRGNVIGVIGITGNPNKVAQFSKIVSVTAELLINQEYSMNEYIIKKKLEEEYIYELLYSNNEYNNEFIQRGKMLGIDITKERKVIVIKFPKEKEKALENGLSLILNSEEFFINISDDRLAILSISGEDISKKIKRILSILENYDLKIGVGGSNEVIQNSFVEAVKALSIGEKLCKDENIYFYEKLKLFYHVEEFFLQKDSREIIDKIEKEDKELVQTLITYLDMNREKNKISQELHIHRNTLAYRLRKIEEITGLSLENSVDLFQYLSSYISYKLK